MLREFKKIFKPRNIKVLELSPVLLKIYKKCKLVDIFIPFIALFYLNKLILNRKYNKYELKVMLMVTLLLAIKYHSDEPINMLDYASIVNLPLGDITTMEIEIFKKLDYNLNVTRGDIYKIIESLRSHRFITEILYKKYIDKLKNYN